MADTSLSEKKIGLLVWQLSNYWQSNLRKILKAYNLTLNEYLILESIFILQQNNEEIAQNEISIYAGIDISVASVIFKLLESKKIIIRNNKNDNRKKIIQMLDKGKNILNKLKPLIFEEEKRIFYKLQDETNNFKNSLKLLLGKSLRIKAKNIS